MSTQLDELVTLIQGVTSRRDRVVQDMNREKAAAVAKVEAKYQPQILSFEAVLAELERELDALRPTLEIEEDGTTKDGDAALQPLDYGAEIIQVLRAARRVMSAEEIGDDLSSKYPHYNRDKGRKTIYRLHAKNKPKLYQEKVEEEFVYGLTEWRAGQGDGALF